MIPLDQRRNWVEKSDALFSDKAQCRMAMVARSSFYYQKEATEATDDEAMIGMCHR
jgi:hypothetical protein